MQTQGSSRTVSTDSRQPPSTTSRPLVVSVIVPVYNEERTVLEILRRVRAAEVSGVAFEIIAVDDRSTDDSLRLLRSDPSLHDVLLCHDRNLGKGAAVRTALRRASGDWVLIQDADLEYSPRDYERLLRSIFDGTADVVYGVRRSALGDRLTLSSLARRGFSSLASLLSGWRIRDVATCLKVFPRAHVDGCPLREDGFNFDPELTMRLACSTETRFLEVPIRYRPRDRAHGKKIRWWHGMGYLLAILRHGMRCRAARRSRFKST